MSRFSSGTLGLNRRQVVRMVKSPPLLLPSLLFPLLLFGAFAGGLSGLGNIPNFGYPDYTTFQFVWVLMVGIAMAGMASGLALAGDFDTKFDRRVLLATAGRGPIVAGYVTSGIVRAIIAGVLLFAVGIAARMEISGSALDILAVVALMLLFGAAITLWSVGLALRTRSLQAGPLMQTPVLLLMFALPVYTPRSLLAGWVEQVATYNPLTPILEAGRGLMIGEPTRVPLAFAVAGGLVVVFGIWAVTGLRGLRPK